MTALLRDLPVVLAGRGTPGGDRAGGDRTGEDWAEERRPGGSVVDAPSDLAILARHGRSFRLAGRLLGREHFTRATALYAVCRAVDDMADEAPDPLSARHALERIARDLEGRGAATAIGTRFRQAGVDTAAAAWLARTMLSDLEPVRIADEAALLRYAAGAAGTVGLMMCDIFGIADPSARARALDLGVAMQLTNIARDVHEDAARDRLYLPADWLPAGATPNRLAEDPAALFAAVERLLQLAERHYRSGALGYGMLPGRASLAIPVAAALYRAIGRCILRAGPAYLGRPRIVVPRTSRAAIMLCTLLREAMRRHGNRHDG